MDKFLHQPHEVIATVFQESAARLNLLPYMVEKDFWVCWVLRLLFSLPNHTHHLIFKGGTSLSKAYHLIERFSEDVDLTMSPSILNAINDPTEKHISGKEQARRVETLVQAAKHYISKTFYPLLREAIKDSLPGHAVWRLTMDEDQQTILFFYPQLWNQPSQASYIKPTIRLECGARGGMVPKEFKAITPYVAIIFPHLFEQSTFLVPTLSAERTFWEKITLLHALYHRHQQGKKIGHRMSRHYYDLYMMDQKNVTMAALQHKDLLKEVVENKKIFFKDPSSSYETAYLGKLRLYPTSNMSMELQQDYKTMEIMMAGNYPSFKTVMTSIGTLEERLHALTDLY